MGENICKPPICLEVNMQKNIKNSNNSIAKHPNNLIKKVDEGPE